ncbi:MAG: 2Fe-2S iron-sulfur cluster binding domain-containing protein [Cyclobacteriaceae bacterium]
MAKITFITNSGEESVLEASSGNLMELAVNNNIQGIEGECGGVCSCATCHVHVSPDYFDKTGAPGDIEADMLELDDNVTEYSRLGCQVEINEDMDGMILHVAND